MSQSTHRWKDYPRIGELTDSDRHRLLATKRRRLALDVLDTRATPVELADVAERVAARENDADAVDEETIERVAVSLHHVHLPMLADVGIIDYDPDVNRVESGPKRLNE